MKILLPEEITSKLTKALKQAGYKEIGGILMGEYVSEAVYRIKDLTIQFSGGTSSFFVRFAEEISNPLQRFFKETGYDFTRFNYLGEWHSHPNFALLPSSTDCKSMWEIVEDPSIGANFAVLMIVQLDNTQCIKGTVTVFILAHEMFKGTLIQEKF
ncbi:MULTISPECIES: Mov34/MPN/PAD-1 family protein [unclassified Nostoc]|uniref:Mov34/MPN/PAD-1 family protein n=1 Tax=unclassified Nostoc TaxID=2593658 RepID=UPI002AD35E35|nr:Mov34/MPN/PAD-1 family protein [Nostoc sp. DedQUE03]MDZ7974488.1 Mov34/MPN/PAD-1 family protein [Nostoc sp. DedQUE03]MDZ8047108.1 Mov34/MPN/PAD-1 family protein [Nostoc sp. DedQUE02]